MPGTKKEKEKGGTNQIYLYLSFPGPQGVRMLSTSVAHNSRTTAEPGLPEGTAPGPVARSSLHQTDRRPPGAGTRQDEAQRKGGDP